MLLSLRGFRVGVRFELRNEFGRHRRDRKETRRRSKGDDDVDDDGERLSLGASQPHAYPAAHMRRPESLGARHPTERWRRKQKSIVSREQHSLLASLRSI